MLRKGRRNTLKETERELKATGLERMWPLAISERYLSYAQRNEANTYHRNLTSERTNQSSRLPTVGTV